MSSQDDDNGEELGLPSDKLSMILVHVGETRKGIKRLEGDVREVKESISTLQSSTVRKDECAQRHVVVAQSINSLDTDLKEIRDGVREIKKSGTGTGYAAVDVQPPAPAPLPPAPTTSGVFTPPKEVVEEVLDQRQEKTRKNLTFWLATIGTVGSLLSAGAVGIYKLVKYLDRVDRMVELNTKESEATRQEIKEQLKRELQPKVVYVRAGTSDAGVAPPPKRPRRRVP
jgi:hypothetical protein